MKSIRGFTWVCIGFAVIICLAYLFGVGMMDGPNTLIGLLMTYGAYWGEGQNYRIEKKEQEYKKAYKEGYDKGV